MKLTTIPFSGFYNSVHDVMLDDAFESAFSDESGAAYPTILQRAFNHFNWAKAHHLYALSYMRVLAQELSIDLEFESLRSPREYNFETDRIFCLIEEKQLLHIFAITPKDLLQERIEDKFTSCSGFVSFYPNTLEAWDRNPLNWDANQIGTLIEAFAMYKLNIESVDDIEMYDRIDSHYIIDQSLSGRALQYANLASMKREKAEKKFIESRGA